MDKLMIICETADIAQKITQMCNDLPVQKVIIVQNKSADNDFLKLSHRIHCTKWRRKKETM
jgi:CO dehydrogenase nickel-insertion accessory protein CooC1